MKMLNKKSILLLITAAIILTMSAGVTVAYLVASTSTVVNTFEPVTVNTTVTEDFKDPTIKKNVAIENSGDVKVYVRAKVVANWCDANGNIVAPWTDNINYNSSWTKGNDGFWYHKGAVAPNASTANLFDSYSYASTDVPVEGAHLEMTIVHQSVQAEPDDAVKELWGDAAASLVK